MNILKRSKLVYSYYIMNALQCTFSPHFGFFGFLHSRLWRQTQFRKSSAQNLQVLMYNALLSHSFCFSVHRKMYRYMFHTKIHLSKQIFQVRCQDNTLIFTIKWMSACVISHFYSCNLVAMLLILVFINLFAIRNIIHYA